MNKKYINMAIVIDEKPICIGNVSTVGYILEEKEIKRLIKDLKKRLMHELLK